MGGLRPTRGRRAWHGLLCRHCEARYPYPGPQQSGRQLQVLSARFPDLSLTVSGICARSRSVEAVVAGERLRGCGERRQRPDSVEKLVVAADVVSAHWLWCRYLSLLEPATDRVPARPSPPAVAVQAARQTVSFPQLRPAQPFAAGADPAPSRRVLWRAGRYSWRTASTATCKRDAASRSRSRSLAGKVSPRARAEAEIAITSASKATARSASSGANGRRSRGRSPMGRRGYRVSNVRPTAPRICSTGQPAKSWTRIRPSSSSLIERDGPRSSWAGQRASHRPGPV